MTDPLKVANPPSVSQDEVQPWHRLGGVEHICELRKSSSVLYAIFVSILRLMYSGRKGRTFGCPDVVWRKDPKLTELWIDTELRWEDQRPDFTPAIFVNLGEMQYRTPELIDAGARTFLSNDGEISYERTCACSAALMHVSDNAGSVCALADNTENYLASLQDQLRQEYCFDHFMVTGRRPLQKKETPQTAGKGKYVSAVTVGFDFTDAWTVKTETPILKTVDLLDKGGGRASVCGTNIEIFNGQVDIEFGNISSSTDTQ
jgi:hypothetical protein